MLGIDQNDLELSLQNVPDRFPVDPCGFHCHMGNLVALQPIRYLSQVAGHRLKAAYLLAPLTTGIPQKHTGGDTLLMDVQPTTAGIHDMHLALLTDVEELNARRLEDLPRVLPAQGGGDNTLFLRAFRLHCCTG
jgi:hypothetical protein